MDVDTSPAYRIRVSHRFDLPTAQALPLAHAPRIRVNGRTAAELPH